MKCKESMTRAIGFIGFGTNTFESPLQLKTSPRWCPLKSKKVMHHTYKISS